jgi:prepilin-type N-terminal cleavage/methylation domain-containing protein
VSDKPRPPQSAQAAGPAGFTLIEVVIVLVILTFISIGIYQMTTETFKLRDELAAEGEFYNSIRMSMDIVQRDVSTMFSPIISRPNPGPSPNPANPGTLPPPPNAQDMQVLLSSDQGKTSSFWLAATDKTGLRNSRFVGTNEKITFVSASHVRVYKDTPESDFAKITYELVRDEENKDNPNKDLADSLALLRTENTDAFDDDDRHSEKYGHRFLLLHGIKKLRFRYWRKDKDNGLGRWETSWDNDKDDYKDKYPDIVEITIEVNGPQKLSFTGVYKFRPEVPLRGMDPSS